MRYENLTFIFIFEKSETFWKTNLKNVFIFLERNEALLRFLKKHWPKTTQKAILQFQANSSNYTIHATVLLAMIFSHSGYHNNSVELSEVRNWGTHC